jgi:TctA family transporter
LFAVALVGLWQSSRLERWSFDGPGPGLVPADRVGIVFVALALIVLIWPGRAASTEDGDTERDRSGHPAKDRRSFAIYVVSLLVLDRGLGVRGLHVVTAVAVSVLIVRFAEGRSWGAAAIVYGWPVRRSGWSGSAGCCASICPAVPSSARSSHWFADGPPRPRQHLGSDPHRNLCPMDALLNGFAVVMTPANLLYCFIGAFLGTVVGILPGLGPLTTIAILLPITFKMDVTSAIIMLSGIYYGVAYGGTVTSVLMRIPGEASSVVTCLDGYEMARKGRAGAALCIAGVGSFVAGTIGVVAITFLSPPLAKLVLAFGPSEYAMMMLAGLSMVTYMSGGSLARALLMAAFGLLLGTIGADPMNMTPRLTFDIMALGDGVNLVPLAIGLFGLSEVLFMARRTEDELKILTPPKGLLGFMPTREEARRSVGPIGRGTVLGFMVGLLPGGGAVIASFLSYAVERKLSKHPEEFGKGAVEGLAGPEAANNAGTTGRVRAAAVHGHSGQCDHRAAAGRVHDPRRDARSDHPGAPARGVLGRGRQHVHRQHHAADPEPAADRPVRAHPGHPARVPDADDPDRLPGWRVLEQRQPGRCAGRRGIRFRRLLPAPPGLRPGHRDPRLCAGSDLRALGAPGAGHLRWRPHDLPAQRDSRSSRSCCWVTVPAHSFWAPTRAKLIAAARFMPGVWAVLVSSDPAGMTRTPSCFQSVGPVMMSPSVSNFRAVITKMRLRRVNGKSCCLSGPGRKNPLVALLTGFACWGIMNA